ncbi:toll/interleukin-1 receptor domain-containing protein [Burkholderia sp. ABCPW 14]|uniref:toll/interleukin-1 receptor domain-containing protein n=1 Tax=Burkholderia sp. ABCPW 14 TaxID=1637860 RepID=UPI0009E6E699|nr:toll/interleukin-1 receptor domain-containing protein [Burkholderia sp. ABCPW 14]
MATKVFLSWSGELSRKLADALRGWLPSALQSVKPYFTPEDIEKGSKWGPEISKELESSNIGIVCLTRDNTEKPWILFEAGALSKSIQQSHVCTLLFDLEPTDIKGPLTSFQATKFSKEDFKKLVLTINSSSGDLRLDTAVMDAVFEMWWPKLENQVADILKNHGIEGKPVKRSERDILEELLELSRMTAARVERPSRMSPRVVMELMEGLEELQLFLGPQNLDVSRRVFDRLRKPLKFLCLEAGIPEAYEKMRMRMPEAEFQPKRSVPSVETGKIAEG